MSHICEADDNEYHATSLCGVVVSSYRPTDGNRFSRRKKRYI